MAPRKAGRSGETIIRERIIKRRAPTKADAIAEKEHADVAERIHELRERLGPSKGFVIRFWRYNESRKTDDFLGSVPFEEFSEDWLAARYGGGEYRAWVVGPNGKRIKHDGDLKFAIGGPSKHPEDKAAATGEIPAALAATIARLEEKLAHQPDTNLGKMAMEMATAMASVQAATIAAFKGQGGGATDGGTFAAQMTAMLDLADRINEGRGEGGADPALAMLFSGFSNALDKIKDVAAAQRASGAQPKRRVLPAANRTTPQPPKVQEDAAPVDAKKILAPFIANLIKLAARQRDPWAYAPPTFDQLSEYPAIYNELLTRTTPEQRAELQQGILTAFPETAAHADWFGEFFEALWQEVDDFLEDEHANPDIKPAGEPGAGEPTPT